MQKITLIAAIAENACIGQNNTMPWHIAEDFAFFKQYTLHKPILMGRKTWDSLPKKPLPERRNIVITRQTHFQVAECAHSLQAALQMCANEPEVCIIGGAEIYRQSIELATDLRITEVKLTVDGDAFFPEIHLDQWHVRTRESHVSQKGIAFDFVHYQRT